MPEDMNPIVRAAEIVTVWRGLNQNTQKAVAEVVELIACYKASGLPIKHFAVKVGLSDSTICNWKRGHTAAGMPWPALAAALALGESMCEASPSRVKRTTAYQDTRGNLHASSQEAEQACLRADVDDAIDAAASAMSKDLGVPAPKLRNAISSAFPLLQRYQMARVLATACGALHEKVDHARGSRLGATPPEFAR